MKVALTYRVLQHWRTPVFRRLASWPGIDFIAFHGSDLTGTKTVNGKHLDGFRHRELATIKFTFAKGDTAVPKPLCPTLPFHLAKQKPDLILAEGGSNLFNNFFVCSGGLAISEATAHGLPVIATVADGCEVDLVEEGKNGHLLPPGDRQELEVALDRLLSHPELLESMKARSRWIIENRFNINTYMENLVAALEYAVAAR